jgi:hypothetical protein
MARGLRPARAIAALGLVVSGCLGFGDLTGGGADDAGSTTTSDASSGSDVFIGDKDAPTSFDAATADGAPYCEQHKSSTFCADFDESDAAQFGFTGSILTDGGLLSVDDLVSESPPGSLHAGSGPLNSGDQAFGDVQRTTGLTPTSSVTLDFDVMADTSPPASSPLESLAIIFASSTRSALQLNLTATSAVLGEEIVQVDGGKEFFPHLLANAIPGSWTHVTISIDSSMRTVTVTVNGAPSLMATSFNAAFTFGPVAINVGNAFAPGPSPGSSVHFDNVLLNIE